MRPGHIHKSCRIKQGRAPAFAAGIRQGIGERIGSSESRSVRGHQRFLHSGEGEAQQAHQASRRRFACSNNRVTAFASARDRAC